MSSIAEYRKLLERAQGLAVKVEPYGLISLRVLSKHERAMALAESLDTCAGGRTTASIASRRLITARALSAWSVSAADLLGAKVPIEDADEAGRPLPCSPEAAELLFDVSPDAFALLSGALFDEFKRLDDIEQEARKN
jgi:hypothetical protein